MKTSLLRLALLPSLMLAASLPAMAESSASSLASDASSASVGASSASIKRSSNISSKTADVAAGEYKVIDMAEVADRPGFVRLTLQAVADPTTQGEFVLELPQKAVAQGHVITGQTVIARHHEYGLEFADATQKPFFLVLDDDWYRELQSHPVVL